MPRAVDDINYVTRLGNPEFVTDAGPPATRTITVWYGVGRVASDGTVTPYNYQSSDIRPPILGPANGRSVSVTYDPLTTVDHTVQQQLIAAIEAQEGLSAAGGDTIIVS